MYLLRYFAILPTQRFLSFFSFSFSPSHLQHSRVILRRHLVAEKLSLSVENDNYACGQYGGSCYILSSLISLWQWLGGGGKGPHSIGDSSKYDWVESLLSFGL